MTEPVDPLEHLDFAPRCDWQPGGELRCTLSAQTSVTWSCGCVMLTCGIHGLPMGQKRKLSRCPIHGVAVFVSKSSLEAP